ncbi:MAG: dipeptidase PepE [Planctomycetota bacterium]
MRRRLLLFSNSTNFGEGYLDHGMTAIQELLGGTRRLVFVPFALRDREQYGERARERFAKIGVDVSVLTADAAGQRLAASAEAMFVGGGNTFRLLKTLQDGALLEVIRSQAQQGMLYVGASAGSNIAAPTIKTTNDMPIVQPRSFDALGLIPFQINPHYLDAPPDSQHMGETREERIREFLEESPRSVLGLREGSWLQVIDDAARLGGRAAARIFRRGREPEERPAGAALDDLLVP